MCSLDITNTIDSLLLHYPNFCRLHLEILPLQLHLDQEQLNFLINFFTNDSCNNDPHLHCENETDDVKSTSNGSNTVVDEALLPFFQVFPCSSSLTLTDGSVNYKHNRRILSYLLRAL